MAAAGLRPVLILIALVAAMFAQAPPIAYAQFAAVPSPAKPDNAYDRAVANPKQDHAARSILDGAPYAQQREPIADSDAVQGVLQTGDVQSWPRLYRSGDLLVTGLLNGAVALFGMSENLFGPPAALAPAGYKKNPGWGEFFIEPGLSATYRLGPSATLYGSFAYVESSTRGMDNCCADNVYYGNRELLFGGIRWRDADSGLSLDASYGQQDYTVGNQMLLGRAGSNGAHRGANQIGPRNAWANAGILKAAWQDFNVQAFYLKPNEEPSEATGTIFNGINVEWLPAGPVRLGFMYLYVPHSNIVTRDQLNIYDLRARVHPVPSMPHFWLDGEYVRQRKSGVAADGWYAQAQYNALDTVWKPLFSLRYASLSGDRPGTTRWEGFDPLYFSGSDPNWYQGQIGSSIFNNTNLRTAGASVTLTPNDKNIIELLYLYFTADQVNSPLTIPAVGAAPASGGGVPAKALASEFDVSYTYILNKNVNVNCLRGLCLAAGRIQGALCVLRRQRQRLVVSRNPTERQLLKSLLCHERISTDHLSCAARRNGMEPVRAAHGPDRSAADDARRTGRARTGRAAFAAGHFPRSSPVRCSALRAPARWRASAIARRSIATWSSGTMASTKDGRRARYRRAGPDGRCFATAAPAAKH